MSWIIDEAVTSEKKITIAYANADTLNKIYNDRSLAGIYKTFDYIHPDGIGIFLASKYLFGKNGMSERFTGSDYYLKLISESINKKHSFFFFGHTSEELNKIQKKFPGLKISGLQEGYSFSDEKVIDKINTSGSDILIIGLSCPVQEKWMHKNKDKVNCKVILAVGDGIKVFSGDKIRGPAFMRKLGLEWLVRMFTEPGKNFRRYLLGIPVFIRRVIAHRKTFN